MSTQAALLAQGLDELKLKLSAAQQQKLLDYLALLAKWNAAYNLTAVRDPDEMVSRHLLDSLSIAPWVAETCGAILDVGSGGGLPGVPLAIAFPQKNFSLLDTVGKKVRFLTQVKLQLDLNNLQPLQARVERFQVQKPFACVVSRAFSELAAFAQNTRHLGDGQTRWLAMKGSAALDEQAALPADFRLEQTHSLAVPGCQGQRHLLILRRVS